MPKITVQVLPLWCAHYYCPLKGFPPLSADFFYFQTVLPSTGLKAKKVIVLLVKYILENIIVLPKVNNSLKYASTATLHEMEGWAQHGSWWESIYIIFVLKLNSSILPIQRFNWGGGGDCWPQIWTTLATLQAKFSQGILSKAKIGMVVCRERHQKTGILF